MPGCVKSKGVTDLGHKADHMPMCQPVCHGWLIDMLVCLGHVKTVEYTDFNSKGTPGDTGHVT